jgi:hypothetical protein
MEFRPTLACRLHLRVRHQPRARTLTVSGARRAECPSAAWTQRSLGSPRTTNSVGAAGPGAPATQGTDAAAALPIRDLTRTRPSAFGPNLGRPRELRCLGAELDVRFPGQAQPR